MKHVADGSIDAVDAGVGNGQFAGTGKLRIKIATVEWGSQAPDGSVYAEKIANGTTGNGAYNGRGNLRVVRAEVVTGNGLRAPNGALRVTGIS